MKNNDTYINDHNATKETDFKIGTTTISKFQQEIIRILKGDVQNFRTGNLKTHSTKWKNVTGDKIILDITKNELSLYSHSHIKRN